MAQELREWRASDQVRDFASNLEDSRGLLHFFDVSPSVLRPLVEALPQSYRETKFNGAPSLLGMIELAEEHDGTLGGHVTSTDREIVGFSCDTLIVPDAADLVGFFRLGPDDVVRRPDGRVQLWWD